MPTMVRNNQPGPTTFSDESTGQKPVVWQGRGDPNRQDVRPVHDALLESVYFQQALENGVFSILDNDQERRAIQDAHRANFQAAQERRQHVGEEFIDAQPSQDIIVTECIGPKGHTGQLCGETVTLTAEQRGVVPPLCLRHIPLKPQFVATPTGKVVDGKPEVTWSRPKLGQALDH